MNLIYLNTYNLITHEFGERFQYQEFFTLSAYVGICLIIISK